MARQPSPLAPLLGATLVIAVALAPPVDGRADHNLVWHMGQHLVLLTLTGPLIAHAVLVTGAHRRRDTPAAVALGAILAVGTVLAWHVPVLFDAADRTVPLHVAEHASFIVGSAALWWLAGSGRRAPAPHAVLAIFVVSLAGTALGAAMTLSAAPWYAAYPNVVEQQVAGALMWSVGGAATTACGLVALVRSLHATAAAT